MLINKKIISKNKDIIREANLPDYEKTYKNFSWGLAEKELAILSNRKLNIAHIAIDRHLETYRKNKIALYYLSENNLCEQYTFAQISEASNRFANVLVKH